MQGPLPQTSLSQSSNLSFEAADQTIRHYLSPSLFQTQTASFFTQTGYRFPTWRFSHWEDFYLPLSFEVPPRRDTVVQLPSIFSSNLHIKPTHPWPILTIFSLLLIGHHRDPHEVIGLSWGREAGATAIRGMCICANKCADHLCPLALLLVDFERTISICWGDHPTLYFHGSFRTQLMMDSSSCLVTWCPMGRCSVSTRV